MSARGLARAVVLLGAISAPGWTASCTRDPLDLPNARATPGTTIVFLGDSWTAGHGVARDRRFSALLEDAIPLEIVNAGVAGDTTQRALARFEHAVAAHDPAIVVVLLGGNDFLQGRAQTDAARDFRAILARILEIGAVPVVIAFDVSPLGAGLLGAGYTAFLADAAEDADALLLDGVLDDILADPALRLDPIHPNEAGHRRIAERLAGPLAALAAAIVDARGG